MPDSRPLRLGTRNSPMALAQAERVRAMLADHHPGLTVEVVAMSTSGDRWLGDLAALGGKGAFTKEVDAALLAGDAELAVHCVEDVPGDRPAPAGTVMAAYLARDDVRDCLVHPGGLRIDELPAGSRIGTSAVRRVAQLALHWPHLTPVAGHLSLTHRRAGPHRARRAPRPARAGDQPGRQDRARRARTGGGPGHSRNVGRGGAAPAGRPRPPRPGRPRAGVTARPAPRAPHPPVLRCGAP
ncbi:hypothetical protein ACPCHT_05955 [Nucisporomicrobium flavum]|uniref:hypothetical protein n=1 Tax=Nucisporomicrobium flavum TaxID=2785915 RepID=UPI003C3020A5